jgi:hypothetical protein
MVEEKTYVLHLVTNENGAFYPKSVSHSLRELTKVCSYCKRNNMLNCNFFTKHLEDLFYYLISHTDIRLYWLTKKYLKKDDA